MILYKNSSLNNNYYYYYYYQQYFLIIITIIRLRLETNFTEEDGNIDVLETKVKQQKINGFHSTSVSKNLCFPLKLNFLKGSRKFKLTVRNQ